MPAIISETENVLCKSPFCPFLLPPHAPCLAQHCIPQSLLQPARSQCWVLLVNQYTLSFHTTPIFLSLTLWDCKIICFSVSFLASWPVQLTNSENTLKGKPLSFRLTSLYVWIMVLQVLSIPNSNFCLYNSVRFLKAFLTFLTFKCGPLPRILISCPKTKTDKFPLRGKHLTHIDSPICNSFLCRI